MTCALSTARSVAVVLARRVQRRASAPGPSNHKNAPTPARPKPTERRCRRITLLDSTYPDGVRIVPQPPKLHGRFHLNLRAAPENSFAVTPGAAKRSARRKIFGFL